MNEQADFTLAVLQHRPTPADVESSLARMAQQSAVAADQGAQLLLCPEASLTGYNISPVQARQVALETRSDCMDRIARLCQRFSIGLAFGFIERCGEQLFNAVRVFDAAGNAVAHYRKTHLWDQLDRELFAAGDAFSPVFTLNGWRMGLLICYDIEFPETSRHLTLDGAELILVPTALMTPWTFVADTMTCVRAAENQVFVAYANYCGPENDLLYVGRSCIIGPDGRELARAGEEPELLLATLDRQCLQSIRRDMPYLTDRRPELYQSLT